VHTEFFYKQNIYKAHRMIPEFDSASNRNEYQESSWGVKGDLPTRRADNLTAICETTIYSPFTETRESS
jgi:hypothetical protein